MRIHIQNPSGEDAFAVTPEDWRRAAATAEETGHMVSFAADRPAFVAGMADAEALVAVPASIAGQFPVHAPALRVIFCLAAGLDALAPFDWLPDGVALLNNRGAHGAKAGEFALMALLMLHNFLPAFATAQRAELWQPRHASTLVGRGVTVLGTGDLGSAAARQARRLGMTTSGVRASKLTHPDFDRVETVEALDDVLARTELLVLACPLTPATRGLLDRRRLSLLLAGGGLVNIGRGALLDQDALCDLLDDGHLSGAVLDVTVPEPLPTGHRLWRTRNVIITPHVSADDPVHYNATSLRILFDNLRALREGLPPPNQVDPARGY